MDGVLTSDGIIDLPPSVAQQLVERTHEAGGLWIADEVQSGHGRTGAAMWGYQRLGLTPDIVTVGKPMGAGHPVAAVITRRELARKFSPEGEFFSTFGGNPVAMAAALAVLDVMDDERVIANAAAVGEYLGNRLRELAGSAPQIAEVRQIGLAIGVEIVRPGTAEPDAAGAKEIVEGMRERGVLIGTTGRHGNVLKIRPPLVFRREHADQLVAALLDTLADVPGGAVAPEPTVLTRDVICYGGRLVTHAIENAGLAPVQEVHAQEVEPVGVSVVGALDRITGFIKACRPDPREVVRVTGRPNNGRYAFGRQVDLRPVRLIEALCARVIVGRVGVGRMKAAGRYPVVDVRSEFVREVVGCQEVGVLVGGKAGARAVEGGQPAQDDRAETRHLVQIECPAAGLARVVWVAGAASGERGQGLDGAAQQPMSSHQRKASRPR